MVQIKAARGTQDILDKESMLWQWIEKEAAIIFHKAGYKEIRTPIFEATELFDRAVGEASDIVNKEMYTFLDKSDRSLTLRPEATAGIARAFVEHNLDRSSKPQKFWYRGPMFRYERPQAGRYRQFHQIGIEAIGSKAPYIDLEVIHLGLQLLSKLGLSHLVLYINSIGNNVSRQEYIQELSKFIANHASEICEDCQRRLKTNPLRCLDCKVKKDQIIYQEAPNIHDFFDEESKQIWQQLLAGLDSLDINYIVDHKLVRGLDYYSHCVFEIKTTSDKLGTQNTVLAGGRYDDLISKLGGNTSPAVGWALGQERLAQLLEDKVIKHKSLYILSDDGIKSHQLALQIRSETEFVVEYDYDGSKFKKQFEKALKQNYQWIVFYLEEERQTGLFKAKNLELNQEFSGLSYQALMDLIKS
jgi:histidyl-tRNA synthetase